MVCSMGAVLHCRICKGCLVQHGHGHMHSCSNGHHSHSPGDRRHSSSDDELVPITAPSSNGYERLPTEEHSDVEMVNAADGNQQRPAECIVQPPHETTNVNIRAAMVHVIGDLIQSFGVFIAAIVILVKVCCSLFTVIVPVY